MPARCQSTVYLPDPGRASGPSIPPRGRYPGSVPPESETEFDPDAMVARFRDRAEAVRRRGLPPVEGAERRRFAEQAQLDFMDFAMLGDAEASLVDGILTLRIDLRPRPQGT